MELEGKLQTMGTDAERMLGVAGVVALLKAAGFQRGATDDTVRRMCEDGSFPRAKRLRRTSPWEIPEGDVRAHIAKRTRGVVRRGSAA